MNKFTRRLVYSSIAFAVTTLCANADPIGGLLGNETVGPSHATLHTSESAPLGSDVTQNSFSAGERLAVRNTFSNSRYGQPDSEVAMFTPSTGKVVSIENSPNPLRSGSRQTAQADIAATDSVATASSGSTTDSATTSSPGATGDSGNQVVSGTGSDSAIAVVSEASAAISDVVDPDNLSVATTTAQVSAADSGSGGFFGADPVSGGGSPEPSTMLMAGSMFLGWGLFLAARRKRA